MRADLGDVPQDREMCGEGPDLVWRHGQSGSREESRPVVERLGREHRLLCCSARGHGRSSPVTDRERYGYDHIDDDLTRTVEIGKAAGMDPTEAGDLLSRLVAEPG